MVPRRDSCNPNSLHPAEVISEPPTVRSPHTWPLPTETRGFAQLPISLPSWAPPKPGPLRRHRRACSKSENRDPREQPGASQQGPELACCSWPRPLRAKPGSLSLSLTDTASHIPWQRCEGGAGDRSVVTPRWGGCSCHVGRGQGRANSVEHAGRLPQQRIILPKGQSCQRRANPLWWKYDYSEYSGNMDWAPITWRLPGLRPRESHMPLCQLPPPGAG